MASSLFTAYYHNSDDPTQTQAVLFKSTGLLECHAEALDVLDAWYSDYPQPNGHRPMSLVVIEHGDTRNGRN